MRYHFKAVFPKEGLQEEEDKILNSLVDAVEKRGGYVGGGLEDFWVDEVGAQAAKEIKTFLSLCLVVAVSVVAGQDPNAVVVHYRGYHVKKG